MDYPYAGVTLAKTAYLLREDSLFTRLRPFRLCSASQQISTPTTQTPRRRSSPPSEVHRLDLLQSPLYSTTALGSQPPSRPSRRYRIWSIPWGLNRFCSSYKE